MAEWTLNLRCGLSGLSSLALDLIELRLNIRTLLVDLSDAIVQLLAARAEGLVVLRCLIQACTQLRSQLRTALVRIVQLALELHRFDTAVGAGNATVKRSLNIVKKSHDSTF